MTNPASRPTRVRWVILALTVCVAVLLYLDRFCLGFVLPFVRESFRLTDAETNFLVGAFFYTYAFGQILGGYLADRFGTRLMLAIYLAVWSALTGVMGYASGFVMLVMLRFGCGLFEAGAYPACAGLIRRWIPYQERGLASSIVSIGGRLGGTVAPMVTSLLMLVFLPLSHPSEITDADLLKPNKLAADALLHAGKGKEPSALLMHVAPHLQNKLPASAQASLVELAQTSTEPTADQRARLVGVLNLWLAMPDLLDGVDLGPIESKLSKDLLSWMRPEDKARPPEQVARENRRILEALFPGALRQLDGDAWQPVLLIYGAIGVLLAAFFYGFFRDTPREHFLCNQAEAELAEAHEKTAAGESPLLPAGVLWRGLISNTGMWASSVVQFGTNFGWIFLGSMMPLYLQRLFYDVPLWERGLMASVVFAPSLLLMPLGGVWTDWMTRKFGTYLGRCFPIATTRFLAALAFVACCFLDNAWAITIALCVFSIASDVGLPAIWAYNLDVGRRNVGLVLGWGNMWGNLGAAVAPTILGSFVLKRFVDFDGNPTLEQAREGYHAVFLTCAAVFVFIGIVSFFIDATRPIGGETR